MKTKLEITCESDDFLPFESIRDFQGDLKTRTDEDYEHLIRSFITYGFSFPFFVWKHDIYDDGNTTTVYDCLDGHGRIEALRRLGERGYEIPSLPVTYIECESEDDAKRALVYVNSLMGKYTEVGVQDFVLAMPDLDISQFHFAGVDTQAIQKKLEKLLETEEFIQSVQPETPASVPQPPPMKATPVQKPPVGTPAQTAEFVTGTPELPQNLDVPDIAVPEHDVEVVVVCQHCKEAFRYRDF